MITIIYVSFPVMMLHWIIVVFFLPANHGCWPFPSPLGLPASTSLPPPSPLVSPNTVHAMGYFPPLSQFPFSSTRPSVPSAHYFQWPRAHRLTGQPHDLSPPSNMCTHNSTGVLESSRSFGANLPDFETVFTTMSN